jgi:WD40 repeat protein
MIRQFRGWWSKHTAEVSSVLFSPDGKRAISGSLDETIRLWDVSTGKHLGALCYQTNAVDDTSPVERLAVFPSGHRILSLKGGRCQEVLVWDAHNLRQVDAEGDLKYAVLHDQSLSIAISPTGKCIGVGYDRNEGVRLYDAGTGLKVKKLVYNTVEDNQYPIPRKIDPSVYCIAFCPASTSLLSGGSDNLVHYFSNLFIDCKDIVVKHCFKGHTSHVTSVTFLSGGRLGLSGSKDHTVRLWGLPT